MATLHDMFSLPLLLGRRLGRGAGRQSDKQLPHKRCIKSFLPGGSNTKCIPWYCSHSKDEWGFKSHLSPSRGKVVEKGRWGRLCVGAVIIKGTGPLAFKHVSEAELFRLGIKRGESFIWGHQFQVRSQRLSGQSHGWMRYEWGSQQPAGT